MILWFIEEPYDVLGKKYNGKYVCRDIGVVGEI
jgi:hypothetical protein